MREHLYFFLPISRMPAMMDVASDEFVSEAEQLDPRAAGPLC